MAYDPTGHPENAYLGQAIHNQPVVTQLPSPMHLDPVNYNLLANAATHLGDTMRNSPLFNPALREQMKYQIANFKTGEDFMKFLQNNPRIMANLGVATGDGMHNVPATQMDWRTWSQFPQLSGIKWPQRPGGTTTDNTQNKQFSSQTDNTQNTANVASSNVTDRGAVATDNTDTKSPNYTVTQNFQGGGAVGRPPPGAPPPAPGSTDTVPAMLTPGEFVMNRAATQANLPMLQAMNRQGGGPVGPMPPGGPPGAPGGLPGGLPGGMPAGPMPPPQGPPMPPQGPPQGPPMGPMPPPVHPPPQPVDQSFLNWADQQAHPAMDSTEALKWAKMFDTGINRAVYMPHGGPNGEPAYAFSGKGGTNNVVPLSMIARHGGAGSIVGQNIANALATSQQVHAMAGPPQAPPGAPAAPPGPPGMQPSMPQGPPPGGPPGAPGFEGGGYVQHFEDGSQQGAVQDPSQQGPVEDQPVYSDRQNLRGDPREQNPNITNTGWFDQNAVGKLMQNSQHPDDNAEVNPYDHSQHLWFKQDVGNNNQIYWYYDPVNHDAYRILPGEGDKGYWNQKRFYYSEGKWSNYDLDTQALNKRLSETNWGSTITPAELADPKFTDTMKRNLLIHNAYMNMTPNQAPDAVNKEAQERNDLLVTGRRVLAATDPDQLGDDGVSHIKFTPADYNQSAMDANAAAHTVSSLQAGSQQANQSPQFGQGLRNVVGGAANIAGNLVTSGQISTKPPPPPDQRLTYIDNNYQTFKSLLAKYYPQYANELGNLYDGSGQGRQSLISTLNKADTDYVRWVESQVGNGARIHGTYVDNALAVKEGQPLLTNADGFNHRFEGALKDDPNNPGYKIPKYGLSNRPTNGGIMEQIYKSVIQGHPNGFSLPNIPVRQPTVYPDWEQPNQNATPPAITAPTPKPGIAGGAAGGVGGAAAGGAGGAGGAGQDTGSTPPQKIGITLKSTNTNDALNEIRNYKTGTWVQTQKGQPFRIGYKQNAHGEWNIPINQ